MLAQAGYSKGLALPIVSGAGRINQSCMLEKKKKQCLRKEHISSGGKGVIGEEEGSLAFRAKNSE